MKYFKLIPLVTLLFGAKAFCDEPLITSYNLGFNSATAQDLGNKLCYLAQGYAKKNQISSKIGYNAGEDGILIICYGIGSRKIQNDLIDFIEKQRDVTDKRPIYVEFREAEVFHEKSKDYFKRGAEKILSVYLIEK